MNKIWLSSPHMGGTEMSYMQEAYDSNWIAPLGPNVTAFEEALEKYVKEEAVVACLASGTSALHLALIMAGVTSGDTVLCQSFTFSASANPIRYQGANPVFIDTEEGSWNMDPLLLEEAILNSTALGKKPKAIIVSGYFNPLHKGHLELFEKANEYDIILIEDAAEALGSTYEGKKCGTFGDFGILSFNGNKIITTSGGGALVCKNEESKKRAIYLATQARDVAAHFQHSEIGYNYRMSNVLAGIGRGQMEVLDKHIGLRRANQEFYKKIFSEVPGITVFEEPNTAYFSNHWLSTITIDKAKTGFSREDLRLSLWEDIIESRPLWKPMHLQPVFKNCAYYGEQIAETLFKNGLCLPSGSNLTEEDRMRIENSIRKLF